MQDARLDLRARDRQLVADRLQRPALDDERRSAVRGLDLRAHLGERGGDPVDRPAAKRVVAGQLEAAGLPREQAGEQAQRRPRVAAVDRRVRLAQAAEAGAFDANRVDVVLVDGDPERADGSDGRLGVRRTPEPAHERLPSATAPTRTARCEIDLSPGTAMCPTSAVAGSIFTRAGRPRRRRRSPAPRAARPRGGPRPRRRRAA